jgi:amino acid transporter
VIEAPASAAPEVPAKVSRVWRIVLLVVAVQALLVVLGTVAFSALGLANDGTGSCGGG